MNLSYRALRFWSPQLGCDAIRLSMYDAGGGEHYAILGQGGTGLQNKAAREAALDALVLHIEDGEDPGPVVLTLEALSG